MDDHRIESSYPPPAGQLLSLGEPHFQEWLDYAALGFSMETIPDLIRMVTDERLHDAPSESKAIWAPIHALRALGQLGAADAVSPLLSLLRRTDDHEDDWLQGDIPDALGRIGLAALEPTANYLADVNHGEWSRSSAAHALGRIGTFHADLRGECVKKLAAQLEKFSEQSETLNATLIAPLWDLRAVEVLPLIERAFASGRVDESLMGDVEDVQIHFGVKTERERPPKPNRLSQLTARLRELEEERRNLERENTVLQTFADALSFSSPPGPFLAPPKIGRNDPCPCGSGNKYKKCCGK